MTEVPAKRRAAGDLTGIRRILILISPLVVIGVLVVNDGGFDLPARQQLWLVIWWGLAAGLAFDVLPRVRPRPGWALAIGGFVALGALQIVSMVRGPSPDLALDDAATTLGYLGVIVAIASFLGPRSWKLAAGGIFATAALVTAYALVGRVAPSLSMLTEVERSLGTERLFSPLGYWNALGAWTAATLAMALAWSADARGRRARAWALAVFPVAAGTLYLTYSRGGVVAAAVSLGLVLALTRSPRRAALHLLVGGAAAAILILAIRAQPGIANGSDGEGGLAVAVSAGLAAGACWVFAHGRISRDQQSSGGARDAGPALAIAGVSILAVVLVVLLGGSERFNGGGDAAAPTASDPSSRLVSVEGSRGALWSQALKGFGASPVLGEGSGSFAFRWAREASGPELVKDAHSFPLETASELGLLGIGAAAVGLGGLLSLALGGLSAARRNGPAVALFAATAAFLASASVDWTWDSAPLACLGLGSAAALGVVGSSPIRASRRSGQPKRPGEVKARWAAVAAAIAIGILQVPGAVSAELVRSSDAQLEVGDEADALVAADRALTAAPWSARAHAARGRALLDLGELAEARAAAGRAISAERSEPAHRLLLARIEAAAGSYAEAAEALRDAVELSPFDSRLTSPSTQKLVATLDRAGLTLEEILTPGNGG